MTVTVMKITFEKLKPRVTYFRNWNEFCNEKFRTQLLTKLSLKTSIIVAIYLLCNQITPFMDQFQCGFRKGFNAQHCLLAMLEKWKKVVDTKKVLGALLADLSKAFDCLPDDLIIAKLSAYGFRLPVLNRNKELRQMIHIVLGVIYSWELTKAPSWDHSCLIYFK